MVVLEGVCSVRLLCFCFVYCFTSYCLFLLTLFMYKATFKVTNADVTASLVFFYIVTVDNFLYFFKLMKRFGMTGCGVDGI
jgi:hypothetical protein